MAKPGIGFKIWTAVLSIFVAVMLFPNIVGKHGVWKSLLITAIAVGAIWLMYLVFGRLIAWAVSEELKRRSREQSGVKKDESGRPAGQSAEH
jgi:ABC-type sulfate transport system permease component